MNLSELSTESRPREAVSALRLAPLVLVAFFAFGESLLLAYSTYSDSSVDSGGTVRGWGVADVTNYYMYHYAYVRTTLTSPTGRSSSSGTLSARNYIRADVSLASNFELGNFTTTSDHDADCAAMGHFIDCFSSRYIDIGHSVNWLKFSHFDENQELCIYKLSLNPGCNPTCRAETDAWHEPCYGYVEIWKYYWRWQGSGTRHCLPLPGLK